MAIINSIFIAAMIHGVLQFSVLLFTPKGNRRANSMLALLIIAVVISMWNVYVYQSGQPLSRLVIDYYLWGSIFLWGPLLYFYIKLASEQFSLNRRLLIIHASPAIIIILLQLPIHWLLKQAWVSNQHIHWLSQTLLYFFYFHACVYFYLCLKILFHRDSKIKDSYSTINLPWLKSLVIIFAALIIVDLIVGLIQLVHDHTLSYAFIYMTAQAMTLFALGYLSLLYPEALFTPLPKQESNTLTQTALSREFIEDFSAKLDEAMQASKVYRKNDLRLSELSTIVGTSDQLLSQLINQHYGKKFYDFINEYRVKDAAAQLAQHPNSYLEKVAFEAGFNNRVSFSTAFKKVLGKTPSQYRNEHR